MRAMDIIAGLVTGLAVLCTLAVVLTGPIDGDDIETLGTVWLNVVIALIMRQVSRG